MKDSEVPSKTQRHVSILEDVIDETNLLEVPVLSRQATIRQTLRKSFSFTKKSKSTNKNEGGGLVKMSSFWQLFQKKSTTSTTTTTIL